MSTYRVININPSTSIQDIKEMYDNLCSYMGEVIRFNFDDRRYALVTRKFTYEKGGKVVRTKYLHIHAFIDGTFAHATREQKDGGFITTGYNI